MANILGKCADRQFPIASFITLNSGEFATICVISGGRNLNDN